MHFITTKRRYSLSTNGIDRTTCPLRSRNLGFMLSLSIEFYAIPLKEIGVELENDMETDMENGVESNLVGAIVKFVIALCSYRMKICNPPNRVPTNEDIIVAAESTISKSENDPDACTEDEIVPISPRGDVVLTIPTHSSNRSKSFRVSTNILSHATPVFDRLFNGYMNEANKLKACDNSSIHLSEDISDAMEPILRVLHHDTCGFVVPTELETMASIALHCDKYDCYSILRPWVAQWLLSISQVENSATSLGLQLFIAFNLRDSKHFSEIFAQASTELSFDFASEWENHDLLLLLPEKIPSKLFDANSDG